jgi:outer membrane protein assembly factor BamB
MTKLSLYLSLTLLPLVASLAFAQSEWLTWGYDQQRTGWNKSETTLSKDNVSHLELKWTAQLGTQPNETVLSTLTAPLVVDANTSQGAKTLVFTVGSDDTVYAIDAETGKVTWQRRFPNTLEPKMTATWLCSNTQNATPVIDKDSGIIYLTTSDGKLRGLSITNGEDRLPPTDYITPHARNWSLNLIDNVIFTPMGRGCGLAAAHFAGIDLKDRRVFEFYTSTARQAGAWGRGGMVRGPKGIYAQTADGVYDPAAGKFGNTVMALSTKTLQLLDSFTPSDWEFMNSKDLDLGAAGPVIFPFKQFTLVASAAKQSVLYLLDANNLGGADHHTALYQSSPWGNDEVLLAGRGVWGAMATWEDPQGRRWILMPMWGPPSTKAPSFQYTYGDAPRGSIMAFEVVLENDKPKVVPVWRSRDMHVPDPPVVANGVVYAIQTGENTLQGRGATAKFRSTPVTNAVLYAFDAENGKELYSSKESIPGWTHFSEPVVAAGKVYVATWDAKVYAFGLKK